MKYQDGVVLLNKGGKLYKIRLALFIILCYLQMVYEIDVFLPMCAVALIFERLINSYMTRRPEYA